MTYHNEKQILESFWINYCNMCDSLDSSTQLKSKQKKNTH